MKISTFAAIVFALFLAGCGTPPKPDVIINNVMPEPPAKLMEPATPPKTIPVPATTQ
jgi:hypothetical protein